MEKQKGIYKKHEILAFLLTSAQTAFLANLFSLIVFHPIKTLFNPLDLLHSFYNPTTLCYITSGILFIYVKFSCRNRNHPFLTRAFLFGLSHFLFTSNFLAGTNFLEENSQHVGIFKKKILINISYLFNVLVSVVAGMLCVLRYNFLNNSQTFTNVDGLVFYFIKSTQEMFTSVMNFYFLDLLFSYWFVALYFTFIRFIVNFIFIFFRVQLVYKSLLSLFNHIIMSNTSVLIYYMLIEVIDRLIIFNSSILNKEWTEFILCDDINLLRYSFHQISGLAYKYTYVCRTISKSQSTLINIEEYINMEYNKAKSILSKINSEHKSLDNKLWITVPQVDKATERLSSKENVSSHKQHNFTKKFKTYGLIDRYISRIVYYFQVKSLINDFNRQMYHIEKIDSFINFLVKHKDCYLLLGDFDRKYSEVYKNFLEVVKKTEKDCELNLKLKI